MKNWLKENWIKIGACILILTALIFIKEWRGGPKESVQVSCPYASPEEFTKDGGDFDNFVGFYFNQRFNPSDDEIDNAVKKLLISKNCDDILSGIEELFQKRNAKNPKSYESKVGFSFQYPVSLFVTTYGEEDNWITISPKLEWNNDEGPMTAIIISWSHDSPEMSAEEWLNGPNSGYNISNYGNYHHRLIGGQDAVITDTDWVVVHTPDNKTRLSIAYLAEEEKGVRPLQQELQMILDTFSFK